MIYLICYAVSLTFAYLAKRIRNKTLFMVLSVLSIIISALLAGFRGLNVGIDTKNYYNSWLVAGSFSSLKDYILNYLNTSKNAVPEILFVLTQGCAQRLTGSYNFFLFICHFLIISCVYIGAFRLRKHAEPELTLLLFYFLYYGQSYNILRQYMAMAILFAHVADLEQRKYTRYFLAVVCAILFHNTAIIGIIPMLVHLVLYSGKSKDACILFDGMPYSKRAEDRSIVLRVYILSILSIISTIFAAPFLRLAIKLKFLSGKYAFYIRTADQATTMGIFTPICLIVEAIAVLCYWRYMRRNDKEYYFFATCSVIFISLNFLRSSLRYGDRISEYFAFLNIITVAALEKQQDTKINHFLAKLIIIVIASFYWFHLFVWHNSSQTMPYYVQIY